jgi:hypothetical protein
MRKGVKPRTNVVILKSKSYEDEPLDLFSKIINTYQLNVKVIAHTNNCIDPNLITNMITIF